jgi:uncharacterized repeat protein (TIGR01451 family)
MPASHLQKFLLYALLAAGALASPLLSAQTLSNSGQGAIGTSTLDLSRATVRLTRGSGGSATGIAEISPNLLGAGATGVALALDALVSTAAGETGADRVLITAPNGYTNLAVTSVQVAGVALAANCPTPAAGQFCAQLSGQQLTVDLGAKIPAPGTRVAVGLRVDVPIIVGPGDFAVAVDDRATPVAPMPLTAGNADGDATDANSLTVTVQATSVSARNSTVTVSPPIVIADGTAASVITITLRDANNQPVAGRTVSVSSSRGATDVIVQPAGPTDANGVTTAVIRSLVPGPTVITATDVQDSLVLSAQPSVLFTQGEVLQLDKRALPTRAAIGQVVSYTIEIRNRGTRPVTAVHLADTPATGLKYVAGSARLDGVVIADPADLARLLFDVGTVPAPVDRNGNGTIDPGEPGYRVLSYAMRIGASASTGMHVNTAVTYDVCETCYLSAVAKAQIEVVPDPTFDLGTIIGKVFYDRDGNGWQERDEPGVAAAMVVLDDGSYALTDKFGRFHFPAVLPGQRLIKLNIASIAGNAHSTGRATRVLSVTPGLLAKANFGVTYQADTESIGHPRQFGAELQTDAAAVPDQVRGSTRMFTVLVNGRPAELPLQDVQLVTRKSDDVVEVRDNAATVALNFTLDVAPSAQQPKTWRLAVDSGADKPVREFTGAGMPPATVSWDGLDAQGVRIRSGGVYFYQLEVEYPDGVTVTSARRMFGVNHSTTVSLELRGGAFVSGSAELTDRARVLLDETAKVIRQYPDEHVVIAGHTDSRGDDAYNQGLSERRARSAFAYLTSTAGLPAERFTVIGYGKRRPVATNSTAAGREQNRRVEVRGEWNNVDRAQMYQRARTPAAVRLNGTDVTVEPDGRFAAESAPADTRQFDVALRDETGRHVRATIRMPRLDLAAAAKTELVPFSGPAATDAARARTDDAALSYAVDGITDAGNAVELDGVAVAVDDAGHFTLALQPIRGENRYVVSATNPAGFVRYANLSVNVTTEKEGAALVAVKPVPKLVLQLPPRGIPLQSTRLVVPGFTDQGNHVFVNETPTEVDASGQFFASIDLRQGHNSVAVRVVDGEGNEGEIRRDVDVSGEKLFMLAFADGRIGQVQRSGGLQSTGGSETVTEGRAAFYLKGRVLGRYLLTAAYDSRKKQLGQMFSGLNGLENERLLTNIDPDTVYPVYGDSSELVYDAESQGKFYLALSSEQLEALVGNYALNLTDTELAAYQRTLYGARLQYHSGAKTSKGESRSEVQVVAADARLEPVRDQIRAAGGSLYFLSHQDVIEGSEQVTLLVRDQNTGLLLERQPQQRNVDYTLQYLQGRLYFNRPVSSIAGASTLIGPNALAGNPIIIQVDYETRGAGGNTGTIAARAKQRLADGRVTVGATYVSDQQATTDYQLGGVDAEVKLSAARLVAEYAHTQGADSMVLESNDGGVTYTRRALSAVQQASGIKLAAEVDIGKLLDRPGHFFGTAYYKDLGEGFAANQNFASTATQQVGGTFSWVINPTNRFSLRLDDLSQGSQSQQQTSVQWQHETERFSFVSEVQDRNTGSGATGGGDATVAAARVGYKVSKNIAVALQHQESLRGPDVRQTSSELDWILSQRFAVRARAAFGAQGDALELGGTYETPAGSIYVAERLTDDSAGASRTTVLGANRPFAGGKAYTEYEWGQVGGHQSLRNLAGIQRDWSVAHGLTVLLSAERSALDAGLTPDERWAVAGGLAYDNGRGLKLSTRNEWRQQHGLSGIDQFISVNAGEWKFSDSLTLLGRYRYGDTQDGVNPLNSLAFGEASVGLAYRPVVADRFNMLFKLTRRDETPTGTQRGFDHLSSVSDVVAADWSYQINPRIEWVGKQAIKRRVTDLDAFDVTTTSWLALQRLNVGIEHQLALGLELRRLAQNETHDSQSGVLTELTWEHFEHMRIGLGYNFTDFSDDLLSNDNYSERGWFLRLQGAF